MTDSTDSYENADNGNVIDGAGTNTSLGVSESITNNNLQLQSFSANESYIGRQVLPTADGDIMNSSQGFDGSIISSSSDQDLLDNTDNNIECAIATQSIDLKLQADPSSGGDGIDSELRTLSATNDFATSPTMDSLDIQKEELEMLQSKVEGIERSEHIGEPSFCGKVCPTSHGCSGATSCDACYGNYPD